MREHTCHNCGKKFKDGDTMQEITILSVRQRGDYDWTSEKRIFVCWNEGAGCV